MEKWSPSGAQRYCLTMLDYQHRSIWLPMQCFWLYDSLIFINLKIGYTYHHHHHTHAQIHIVCILDTKEEIVIFCVLVSAKGFQFYFARNNHIPAEWTERCRGFAVSAELSAVRAQTGLLSSERRKPIRAFLQGLVFSPRWPTRCLDSSANALSCCDLEALFSALGSWSLYSQRGAHRYLPQAVPAGWWNWDSPKPAQAV